MIEHMKSRESDYFPDCLKQWSEMANVECIDNMSSFNLFNDDSSTTEVSIVFFGKSGSGKSSLANAFVHGHTSQQVHKSSAHNDFFEVGSGVKPVTRNTSSIRGNILGQDKFPIRVIDTPSLDYGNDNEVYNIEDIINFVRKQNNIFMFLFTLNG